MRGPALHGSDTRFRESDLDIMMEFEMVEFEPAVRVGPIKFESLVEELAALPGRSVALVTKRGMVSDQTTTNCRS